MSTCKKDMIERYLKAFTKFSTNGSSLAQTLHKKGFEKIFRNFINYFTFMCERLISSVFVIYGCLTTRF